MGEDRQGLRRAGGLTGSHCRHERFARIRRTFRAQPIPRRGAASRQARGRSTGTRRSFPARWSAPATLLESALAEDLDRGGATLALGRNATARTAALINGTAAHTIEFDDIYRDAIYHPGAPTIAAALAVAQERGASGEAFLRGVIVGYEISTRIGAAMGRAHYRYWHNTGTVGSFGAAAAAAAMLLAWTRERFAHALATVTTFAAGLQQAFRMDSMSKPLHAGHAAEAGLLAALAAREGVTGSLDVIDGEAGFGRAMSDGPDWDQARCDAGHGLPHHAHDLQEPRLLRPHLRRDRRRARAAAQPRRAAPPTSRASASAPIARRWKSPATSIRRRRPRRASASSTWWRRR